MNFVYDVVSVTYIKFCEYMLRCVMHKLFVNKMLQKL